MLQEELRRYKHRVGEQEGVLAGHARALAAVQDELGRARERLRQCAVSPAQLLQDRKFREALQDRCALLVCWRGSIPLRTSAVVALALLSAALPSCTASQRCLLCPSPRRDATIRQLQQRGDVLEKARDARERRLGQELAAEKRAAAGLRREMQQLQVRCVLLQVAG